MIRHLIFDMGGVLLDWNPDDIIARLGIQGEDAELLRREVFDCSEWVSMDRGSMTQAEGLARICRRLPECLHKAAASCVLDWWKEPLIYVEGMDALIREVHSLGYDVYLLSNATGCVHEFFHRLPAHDCFRGAIVSADWGLLKPQREIYEKLFESFGLQPEECFFIDDNPLNIDGARCVGMPGTVFFKDLVRLRRELNEAGIPVTCGN